MGNWNKRLGSGIPAFDWPLRKTLKRLLSSPDFCMLSYMATIVAKRYNPMIKTFYQRSLWCGQSQEDGPRRLYAQTAVDSQCDAEEWKAVAGSGQSVGLILRQLLMPKVFSLFGGHLNLTLIHPASPDRHFAMGSLTDRLPQRATKMPDGAILR